VAISHVWLSSHLRSGDHVVDATCGNGNDTLLLAGLVGKNGRVWAFDIQEEAIRKTELLLENSGISDRVRLINSGHEKLSEHISFPVSAFVFNLGYLPGGSRNIITKPETTLSALSQATELLLPGGIIAVTLYPGHSGGDSEASAVNEWASSTSPQNIHAWRMHQTNVPGYAPYFILLQKALS